MTQQQTNEPQRARLMPQVGDVLASSRQLLEQMRKREDFHTYRVDITKEVNPAVAILSIDGIGVATEGNISAIVGEAKSKKTFLCTALVAGVLNRRGEQVLGSDPRPQTTVLWVDTEQSMTHVQLTARRVHRLAGYSLDQNEEQFKMLALREIEPKMRTKMLFEAIEEYKPRLIVIDGISDLIYNTNDLEESEGLITTLMRVSSRLKNHIIAVLHTNPGSDKARGHIGSALLRKSESIIYVRKVKECSVVEPQFCRNEPFERFAFRINSEALPELCEMPSDQLNGKRRHEQVLSVLEELGSTMVERKVLLNKLKERFGCGEMAAYMRIKRAIESGAITVDNTNQYLSVA